MDAALQDVTIKIVLAGGLGALVGLDRELSDQPAGLRTHILVSLGAALFTMAGADLIGGESNPVDPTRIAAQVVTGIGFLGAGAIIRQGMSVRGLTTAAGLWVTAAIGTAVGLGYIPGALITTVVAVFSLFGLKRVERMLLGRLKPGRYEFDLDTSSDVHFSTLGRRIEEQKVKIHSARMDAHDNGRHFTLQLRLPPRMSPQELAEICSEIEGVNNVDWRR